MNHKLPIVIWCSVLILSAIYTFSHVKFEANILKLLPKYESKITSTLIDHASAKINDKLIVVIANESQEKARSDFLNTRTILQESGLFTDIQSEIDFDQFQDLYQELSGYRYLMMAKEDQHAMLKKEDKGYFIEKAMIQLYGLSGMTENQLNNDPLFFFQRIMNQLSEFNQTHFDGNENLFYQFKEDKHHYIAIAQLQQSAFSPEYQTQISDTLNKSNAQLNQSEFLAFGSVLYAQQAYLQAKGEISTVGVGSIIGILILFLLVFGSLAPLIVSLSSIALALVFALAISLLVFTKVHLFALVFGSTIAGVSIDYCFHYLCESLVNKNTKNIIKQILPGLIIGFCSSAMVYLGFVITGYEVLAQISLFSICGLFAVLINVLLLFPLFVRSKKVRSPQFLIHISGFLIKNPLAKLFDSLPKISFLFVLIILANFFWLTPNDDVRALQNLSSDLKKQELIIKDLLAIKDDGKYALIHASSIDELLELEHQVIKRLRDDDQSIIGLSDFIASVKQQKQINYFYQEIYQSTEFENYLIENGLDQNIRNKQMQNINSEKQIDYKIFENLTIQNLLSQRWLGQVKIDNHESVYALAIPLKNNQIVIENKQVVMVEQASDASKLFEKFRIKSLNIVMISALILFLILAFVRYGFKKAAHILMLPFFAGLTAIISTQVFGYHVSLFTILALLLILGMGIDYVVFLIEADNTQHVMFALLLSSMTTILSFGLLSLSQVAVIKSFGFTVAIGIITILFISPAIIKQGKNHA